MTEDRMLPGVIGQIYLAGTPVDRAKAAMIMLHGRGATAHDILTSVAALNDPDFAYLAPDTPDHTWYPRPFMSPLSDNEPFLSSSLATISNILAYLGKAGLGPEQIVFFGFSQGACLGLEYAARNARRYGAVVGLSGGLIGPDELQRHDRGSLAGSPVFLGCSDADPHIPKYRVERTAEHVRQLSGVVTMRLYPNMAHTINDDEIAFVRSLMAAVKTVSSPQR